MLEATPARHARDARDAARSSKPAMDEIAGRIRIAPTARSSTRREGFAEYFFSATPIAEIMELNIGSRPAARRFTGARSRICARFRGSSRGGSAALLLPGSYGFGSGGRGLALYGAVQPTSAHASRHATEDGTRLAVFPHAAVEHGDGAREDRSRDRRRATRNLRATRRCGSAIFARDLGASGISRRWHVLAESPARSRLLESNPLLARAQASAPVSRSAESPAGRADQAASRRHHRRARQARHPSDDQRNFGRPSKHRVARSPECPPQSICSTLRASRSETNRRSITEETCPPIPVAPCFESPQPRWPHRPA